MTTALLTITHDEEQLLPGMLASVRDLIDGPTLAFHVGERQETADILRDFGAEVEQREWTNDLLWNDLYKIARGRADRLLFMSANSVLAQTGPLPELGDTPSFMIRYRRGPYEFRLPNLLRGDIEWWVSAPVHGVLEPTLHLERDTLDALVVEVTDADGRRQEKIERYLPILEQMVADDPQDPRARFYLARTYFDLGRYQEAIAAYEVRIMLGGWDEEVWHAHYMKGVAQIKDAQFENGRNTLLAAYLRRPTRAEPLHAICKSMLPPDDLLFIERDVYGTL